MRKILVHRLLMLILLCVCVSPSSTSKGIHVPMWQNVAWSWFWCLDRETQLRVTLPGSITPHQFSAIHHLMEIREKGVF